MIYRPGHLNVGADYQGFASENPDDLAKAIAKGIPATLRGMMWQHMAASKDPELEDEYLRLLKESSTHEKAITRDLGRYESLRIPKEINLTFLGHFRTTISSPTGRGLARRIYSMS